MPIHLKLYKDREKARILRNKQRKRNYAKGRINATNSKSRYTEKELLLILDHDITDAELSKLLGRSVESIQIKRARLKKSNNGKLFS